MKTLNLEEAAAFLHMHPYTLQQKIHMGEIPAAKPGKRWVLVEDDLVEYLRRQYRSPVATHPAAAPISDPVAKIANFKKGYLDALGLA